MTATVRGLLQFCAIVAMLWMVTASRLSFSSATGNPIPLDDLPTFVAAASAVQAGENPYDMDVIRRQLPDSSLQVYPYVYTPVFAQILSVVPIRFSWNLQDIWMITSAVLLALWLVYTVKASTFILQSDSPWYGVYKPTIDINRGQSVILLCSAVTFPLSYLLLNGQLEPLLLPLLTIAVISERRGRSTTAGVLIGSVLIVKHAALFVVLWLLFRRSWRTLAWMGVTGVTLSMVSVVVFGLQPWKQFFLSIVQHSSTSVSEMGIPLHDGYNLSFLGLASRFGVEQSSVIAALGVTFFIGVCMYLIQIRSRRGEPQPDGELLILAITSFLVLPYFWTYHLMYMSIPTIFLGGLLIVQRDVRTRDNLFAMSTILLANVLAPGNLFWRAASRFGISVSTDISGTLTTLLLLLCVYFLCRRLANQTQPGNHVHVADR